MGRTTNGRGFPWDTAPQYLLRDLDAIYGERFCRRVQSLLIEEVITTPRSPWQNPYVERIIGSIRGYGRRACRARPRCDARSTRDLWRFRRWRRSDRLSLLERGPTRSYQRFADGQTDWGFCHKYGFEPNDRQSYPPFEEKLRTKQACINTVYC